jgi:hypothetical protein
MSSPNNSTKRTSSFLRNPASLQVLRENLLLAKTTLGEDSHAYRLLREKIKVATQAQLTASNQHGQQPLPPPQQQQKKYTTRDQMPSPSTTAPPPDPAELEPAPQQDSSAHVGCGARAPARSDGRGGGGDGRCVAGEQRQVDG